MAELLRYEFIEGMKKDFYEYQRDWVKDNPEILVHPTLFEQGTATGEYEQSTRIIGAGNLHKRAESVEHTFGKVGEGWTVQSTWDTYSDGLEFSMENVKDFSESKISNLVADCANSWLVGDAQTRDQLAANVFNYGGHTAGNAIFNGSASVKDPSGDLCYDGKPFFNLSGNLRPLTPNGTEAYYNAHALPMTEANIQTIYNQMTITNAVNSRGQKVILKPNVLWYHPSQRFTANVLLTTAGQVDSAQNNNNTVPGMGLTPVEWRFLDTAAMWGLGYAKKGIKFWNRESLVFDFFRDDLTKGYKATVDSRFGIEVNDFRYWTASNAPTS